ncbi:formylglycine-generating enzyme family protein [Marinovum sp.]|uniref:formylglycine-generating enzyme family protein n=1 Tax=Marinovum sp. TaxID=2024839 RepID=UPI003A9200CE
MTAATLPDRLRITPLASGLAVAAALILGAALTQRGPASVPVPLPEMAEVPVLLASGAVLHVQRYEVTVAEWNRCHAADGCSLAIHTREGLDPAITPATGLSHADTQEYLRWINSATGQAFRLPSLEEWQQMARTVLPDKADPLFTDPALTWASAYLTEGLAPRALRPQGSFAASPEGIADLDGSVWEWTHDCYAGSAEGLDPTRCPAFFVGGEHIAAMFYLVRDPARGGCAVGVPPAHLGMRLVSDDPL